jgi:hypothetical protein
MRVRVDFTHDDLDFVTSLSEEDRQEVFKSLSSELEDTLIDAGFEFLKRKMNELNKGEKR